MTAATDVLPDPAVRISAYFDTAMDNPRKLVRDARKRLRGVDFDSFVATGLSGTMAATVIGAGLRKNVLILRKPDDRSHHNGSRPAVGRLGRRFIFLDDFVSSGATRQRVLEQLEDVIESWSSTPLQPQHFTYVGDYLYNPSACGRWGFFPGGQSKRRFDDKTGTYVDDYQPTWPPQG